ncbi:MAG: transposase [Flavobacteriaceae bacterium]|nr:transposase [Flavobacteriaceae bacterium]NQY31536.1 transposase [Flavobacteriaceae bacterium]
METTKKQYTTEYKLKLIKECATHGVVKTLKKHNIYSATFYSWKNKFEKMGEQGLSHSMTVERLKKIQALEEEVDLLKKLLAEKQIESSLKDDLLKKKYPKVKRKYS